MSDTAISPTAKAPVALVHYPSRKVFLEVIGQPEYAARGARQRVNGAESP